MELKNKDYDDKDLVILAVTIIAVISLIVLAEPVVVISSIVSGLFGIAVGKSNKE